MRIKVFFSKKNIIFYLCLIVLLLTTLLIGLKSGGRQDSLYVAVRSLKNKIFPQNFIIIGDVRDEIFLYEERKKEFSFNNYNQLLYKHDQIQVSRPEITSGTMIAFVFGQSNSANHGGEKYFSKNDKVLNYYDGNFYLASDPLLGATGIGGNVWVNLANKIIDNKIADKVILIAAGVSGTSVELWSKNHYLYHMLELRLIEAKKNNLEINYFFWHQGESDSNMHPERYQTYLEDIIKLTKKLFPNSKFFVAQVSSCGILRSSERLLNAQKKMTKIKGVYLGPNTDLIDYRDRYDGCHFSGRGLDKHAQSWLEVLKNLSE